MDTPTEEKKQFVEESKPTEHKIAETVSIVSHQLKTPLAAIKGFLEVLFSEDLGKLNPKQKEYLKDTIDSNQRMISLVKDFLDVSKIEADKLELRPTPTNLEEIIKETIKELSLVATARNCNVTFNVSGPTPLLNVDPLKIKQVVLNFISNAIEYNKPGRGEIVVELYKKGSNVVFSCQDGGIGIPETDKKKIFTKFYRSERSILRKPEGSGLGLFIAKAIVEKSGGKMWFKSKEGKGSIFYFSLPIKKI